MTFSTVKKDLDSGDNYNERLEDAIKAFVIIEMNDALDPSPPAIEVVSFLNATIDLPKNDKFTSHHLGGNLYEISFNPVKKYTEGNNNGELDRTKNEIFQNQLQENLKDELAQAKRLGVKPISPKNAAKFDKIINEGPIKWVFDEAGELKIMEKFKHGEELKHPVLSEGKSVLAAGEAEIVGNSKDGYYILEFNNSGHFKPSTKSLSIGRDKFKEYINVLNDF